MNNERALGNLQDRQRALSISEPRPPDAGRLWLKSVVFDPEDYLLLDDTLPQGGTLVQPMGHLEAEGDRLVGKQS